MKTGHPFITSTLSFKGLKHLDVWGAKEEIDADDSIPPGVIPIVMTPEPITAPNGQTYVMPTYHTDVSKAPAHSFHHKQKRGKDD